MASYAKHMMELATRWVTANPNPASPYLNLPDGISEQRAPTELDDYGSRLRRKIDDARSRALATGNAEKVAEIDRYTPDALSFVEDAKNLDRRIADLNTKLTDIVNAPPSPAAAKSSLDGNGPSLGNLESVHLGRWSLAWARSGCNVFDLSPDFTAAMLLTDPTDLDISAARLPFPGLLITMPSGFAVGAEGGHYTKIHAWEVAGRDVRFLNATSSIDATDDLPEDERIAALQEMRAYAEKRRHDLQQRLVEPTPSSTAPFLCIHATDGARAFTTFVPVEGLSWRVVEDLPEQGIADDADARAQRTIQQIVFGMLAYVSAVEGAVTPREVQRKPKRSAGSPAPTIAPTYSEVGRTVRIDPQLVRAARGGSREIALHIKHRFIVRGHYRNQAHGPKRSERTRRWIAPFWKGPDEGARIVHTYKPEKRP